MNIEQFDYSTDLLAVVIWQYNEATNLLSLLNQKQAWYDTNQTQYWQNWYDQVFNLSAVNPNFTLFGAAVWSIILNISLYVPIVPPEEPGVVWGFNAFQTVIQNGVLSGTTIVTGLTNATSVLYVGMDVSGTYIQAGTTIDSITNATTIVLSLAATGSGTETLTFSGWPDYENDNLNFNNAPFPPSQQVISLTLSQQIFLLLLKYFNCTNRGTISYPTPGNVFVNNTANQVYFNNFTYNVNYYLQYLCTNMGDAIGYPGGTIYCIDNLNMTISYDFSGSFPSNLLQAIQEQDLLPRPAGVAIV